MTEHRKPSPMEREKFTAGQALARFGVFLFIVVAGLVISRQTPLASFLTLERIAEVSHDLGSRGVLLILLAGLVTPLFFLPRWPIAFLAGLLFGICWGTVLATTASALGALLHYSLSRSLLSPLSDRLRVKYRVDHITVPRNREFVTILLLRAFPLSSFVATNLLAGTLGMHPGRFLCASLLGMIPSSILYTSAGKLLKKPDDPFYVVAGCCVVLMIVGTMAAHHWVRNWLGRSNGTGSRSEGTGESDNSS